MPREFTDQNSATKNTKRHENTLCDSLWFLRPSIEGTADHADVAETT